MHSVGGVSNDDLLQVLFLARLSLVNFLRSALGNQSST